MTTHHMDRFPFACSVCRMPRSCPQADDLCDDCWDEQEAARQAAELRAARSASFSFLPE